MKRYKSFFPVTAFTASLLKTFCFTFHIDNRYILINGKIGLYIKVGDIQKSDFEKLQSERLLEVHDKGVRAIAYRIAYTPYIKYCNHKKAMKYKTKTVEMPVTRQAPPFSFENLIALSENRI